MTTLRDWLLERLWYVHPVVQLVVTTTPDGCLRALAEATRPNLNQLQHRNLFLDGRRYYIEAIQNGFYLTTNSTVPWRRRSRTALAGIVHGEFVAVGESSTLLRLRARMRWLYWLDIFPVPLFMTSLLIFAPWPQPVITGLIITLFTLSIVSHRLTAALQATDTVYFVQKVLEDLTPYAPPLLPPSSPDVVTTGQNFGEAWQKFYDQHKAD
ncbi:MAG: hypothetical protein JNJ78_18085 [Anaerolineae bacterium]|nr:hypothetical protein [Anaerolineae bacterium]